MSFDSIPQPEVMKLTPDQVDLETKKVGSLAYIVFEELNTDALVFLYHCANGTGTRMHQLFTELVDLAFGGTNGIFEIYKYFNQPMRSRTTRTSRQYACANEDRLKQLLQEAIGLIRSPSFMYQLDDWVDGRLRVDLDHCERHEMLQVYYAVTKTIFFGIPLFKESNKYTLNGVELRGILEVFRLILLHKNDPVITRMVQVNNLEPAGTVHSTTVTFGDLLARSTDNGDCLIDVVRRRTMSNARLKDWLLRAATQRSFVQNAITSWISRC